jgi:hypothetical protein
MEPEAGADRPGRPQADHGIEPDASMGEDEVVWEGDEDEGAVGVDASESRSGEESPDERDPDDALKDVDAEFEEQDDSREAVLTSWLHQDDKDPDVIDADRRMAALFARAAKGDQPPRATDVVAPDADVSSDEASAGTEASEPQKIRSRSKRTVLVLGAVVVLIAAAVVVGWEATNGTTASSSPQTALSGALIASVGGQTARVAMVMHMDAGGAALSESGGGQVSLATGNSNLAVTYTVPGETLTGRTIVDGPTGYYNIGAWLGTVVPGKSWISLDQRTIRSGVSGVGLGGIFANPGSLLAVLHAPGSSVQSLGGSTVDGTSVTGYSVHVPPGSNGAASHQIPAFVRAEASQIPYSHLDYVVYVDGAHHLRQVRATGAYRVGGKTVTVATTLDLSRYGSPLHVGVPRAAQVVSLAQLNQALSQRQMG